MLVFFCKINFIKFIFLLFTFPYEISSFEISKIFTIFYRFFLLYHMSNGYGLKKRLFTYQYLPCSFRCSSTISRSHFPHCRSTRFHPIICPFFLGLYVDWIGFIGFQLARTSLTRPWTAALPFRSRFHLLPIGNS